MDAIVTVLLVPTVGALIVAVKAAVGVVNQEKDPVVVNGPAVAVAEGPFV